MEFIKSWKFMLIIFVVIAVTAIALTIYGVVSHEEPGFDPDMTFLADRVARGTESVPIDVCVSSYTVEDEDSAPTSTDLNAVRHAANLVNTRVGFDLLNVGPITRVGDIWPVDCIIHVSVGVPIDVEYDEGGGWAYRCHDACCIDVSNTGTAEMTSLVLQHELGHCLGLAHDDFELSIMRPRQSPTSPGQIPPWITDYDRELLREAYGR